EFAQAYAGQSLVYVVISDYSGRITPAEAFARATDLATRAMALDPTLPEPYAALGLVAEAELRRTTADALLRRAIALRPSFATAYQWRGTLLMSSGKLADGLASLERATSLDPRSLVVANNHSEILLTLGRYADAKKRCEPVLEFAPNYVGCLDNTSRADLLLGDFEAARVMLERLAGRLGSHADWVVMMPIMASIRCDPRFVAIIHRLKTTVPYAAKVCAGKQ